MSTRRALSLSDKVNILEKYDLLPKMGQLEAAGTLLRHKAEDLAAKMGNDNFKATEGCGSIVGRREKIFPTKKLMENKVTQILQVQVYGLNKNGPLSSPNFNPPMYSMQMKLACTTEHYLNTLTSKKTPSCKFTCKKPFKGTHSTTTTSSYPAISGHGSAQWDEMANTLNIIYSTMPKFKGRNTNRGNWSQEHEESMRRSYFRKNGLEASSLAKKSPSTPNLDYSLKLLIPEHETALVDYVKDLSSRLMPLSREEFLQLTFQLAEKLKIPHRFSKTKKMAGKDFYQAFMSRHPDLSLRTPESTSLMRCVGFNRPQPPPHTTHKLQPLDRTFMKPFKDAYYEACGLWMRKNPGARITQYEIAGLVNTAFTKVSRNAIAQKGFECTGIVPFNAQIFDDLDFMSSEMTNIAIYNVQPANSSAQASTVENNENENGRWYGFLGTDSELKSSIVWIYCAKFRVFGSNLRRLGLSLLIRQATMADLRQCSREFLTEFIALYESFPCVWRVKSKEYSDRDKKAEAYERIGKVNKSIRSGSGEDEIYKPSLWYFDLLHFLNDQETPRQSRNTMDENEESAVDEPPEQVEEDVHESAADGGRSETPATSLSEASTPHSSNILSRNTSRSHSSTRKRKGVPNDDGTTDIMKLVGNKLESLQAEDAFQVFGKHVANKLRDVPSSQNAIAQKLISDVLFEAELGTLTRNFQIVDMTSQRQDDFGLVNGRNWRQHNMPQHPQNMSHTRSSQVGQYHSFSQQSQPMPHTYVPEQLTHTQEYETIGQIPAVSRNIPQEGNQDQQTLLAHSSAANYLSTFQSN
ncbi:hypothetical protein NQ318_001656 [Aromia moschata]|uniref:MADF domain-containing protein n=1 Tax=Aromia moschata TaxID=1265417 RepID=A0AAV8X1Y8_9CUCU|nr:hypothetical protein NQ318_001656 [Aromia moschata]